MNKIISILIFSLITQFSFAFDFELSAAVKRPSSNEVFVGGTFNTIIVFDIEKGETVRYFKIEKGIKDLQFDKKGKILLAASTSTAYLINPDDGNLITAINGSDIQLFAESPYFIDMKKYGDTKVVLFDTDSGKKLKEIRIGFQPKVCGFDKEFKTLYVVSSKNNIGPEEESKHLLKIIEKSTLYNCYNQAYTSKQADNSGAYIYKYDIKNDTEISNIVCPFDFTGTFALLITPTENDIYISDWDMLIKIDINNITTAIECNRAAFAYANHTTVDYKNIIIASTKSGNIYNILESKWIEFNLRENNELVYTADIFSTEDRIWLLSKDYTLISMNYNGEKDKEFKINNAGEKGFSVYYHNGYSKKEDRDKESEIINQELNVLSLPNIDLEQFIGKSDVILATFSTVTEAEEFIKNLKNNKLNYITRIAPAKFD
ncbi:MAG TPA: hypothetical protein PKN32_06980 [Bacteroidales bacterium]|nr:hypothetical protein [Bacteroidales bacterium]